MPNILVVDRANQSSALVKSVLVGKAYRVSISTDYDEALLKLDTGLFDLILVDTEDNSYPRFLKTLKATWFDLPVIALAEGPLPETKEFFSSVFKPLHLAQLIKEVQSALEHLNNKFSHRRLLLPVELSTANRNISCLITELSLKGAWVEPEITEKEKVTQFTEFFLETSQNIVALIRKNQQSLLKIITQLAFTEISPDDLLRRAGLIFPKLAPGETQILAELIAPAA